MHAKSSLTEGKNLKILCTYMYLYTQQWQCVCVFVAGVLTTCGLLLQPFHCWLHPNKWINKPPGKHVQQPFVCCFCCFTQSITRNGYDLQSLNTELHLTLSCRVHVTAKQFSKLPLMCFAVEIYTHARAHSFPPHSVKSYIGLHHRSRCLTAHGVFEGLFCFLFCNLRDTK